MHNILAETKSGAAELLIVVRRGKEEQIGRNARFSEIPRPRYPTVRALAPILTLELHLAPCLGHSRNLVFPSTTSRAWPHESSTTRPKHGAERSWCESKPDNGERGRTVSPPDKLGISCALNTITGTRSHEASHLLSQPSSTPFRHQHGRATRRNL